MKKLLIIFGGVLFLMAYAGIFAVYFSGKDLTCDTTIIPIEGALVTTQADIDQSTSNTQYAVSGDIVDQIREANNENKNIILLVDSPGGSFVAGEDIMNELKKSNKSTAALVKDTGASAAYLAMLGVKKIFVSKGSNVGGVGVMMELYDQVKKNETDGINYTVLSSGKYKTLGNENEPLNDEGKKLLQSQIDSLNQDFISYVKENRNISSANLKELSDAKTYLGAESVKLGLSDQIGNMDDILEYFKQENGTEPHICKVQ